MKTKREQKAIIHFKGYWLKDTTDCVKLANEVKQLPKKLQTYYIDFYKTQVESLSELIAFYTTNINFKMRSKHVMQKHCYNELLRELNQR